MTGEREMGNNRINTDRASINSGLIGALSVFINLCLIAVAYASGGGGEGQGPNLTGFAWKLFNFLVIAGVCYWLAAKKVREFFAGRREGIKSSLAEAAFAREDAEKKFREYDAKLDRATGEIDEITRMIQAQGVAEKERIIGEARKAAEKMREDVQARIEQEFSKAGHKLRVEAVRLSVQMAEEMLLKNIRVEDHEAMVRDYIEKVVHKN